MRLEFPISRFGVIAEDYLLIVADLAQNLRLNRRSFHERYTNLDLVAFRLKKNFAEFQRVAGHPSQFFNSDFIAFFYLILLASGLDDCEFHNFLKIPNPPKKIQPFKGLDVFSSKEEISVRCVPAICR